jgi:hypothetical protein
MTDPRTPDELDVRLRTAFRGGDLPAAPATLRDALERVPDAAVTGHSRTGRERSGGSTWGLLGLAAVLAIGGAVAVAVGQRGPSVMPAVVSSEAPSATAPSASTPAVATRLTYEVVWSDLTPENEDELAAIETRLGSRLEATGLVGYTVGRVDGRLTVDLPAGVDPDPIRRLLGQSGEAAFVPLGDTLAREGDVLDLTRLDPLFESDGVSGAAVGADQTGKRVVTIQLSPAAAEAFRAWTADHIGSYFAITIDGVVVAVPVINSEIPGGSVEIGKGDIDGWDAVAAAELVAVLEYGPLPVPIREVAVDPLPSGIAPSPSSVAPVSVRHCEPWPAVGGDSVTCDEAVTAALPKLPVGHPPIATIDVRHQCFDPDRPDAALDCAVQLFAIVDVRSGGGPPDVTIGVRAGANGSREAFVLPGPRPSGELPSFELNRAHVDLGCDTIMPPYRSWVFHIDPTASEPVWAVADTGARLRVEWGSVFRGIVGPPPLVVDDHGLEVIRDGTTGTMPDAAWPSLAGRFVCPSTDTIYVLDGLAPR